MTESKITIPMFPLKMVVLPGEEVKLHIFEDRYKQLLTDCEDFNLTFGIPVMMEDTMLNIGTEVRLERVVKRYETGESDILIKGLNLFSIIGFFQELPKKLYGGGQIRVMDLQKYKASDELISGFLEFHNDYQNENNENINTEHLDFFDIANQLYLNPIQKLKLINNKTAESREEVLFNQMRFLKIIMMQERKIKNQFYPN